MTHPTRAVPTVVAALAALLLLAAPAAGQLADASARTLGMGQNGSATARGFQAIASNPAGLALEGTGGFSLAVAPLRIRTGLDPIGLPDLKDVEGSLVTAATKDRWLADVTTSGGETGSFGIRLSGLSLQVGQLGFQVSTLASGNVNLSPGLVELLLYGNAGRSGEAQSFDVGGSTMDAFAATTAAVSFGLPLSTASGEMGLGATLKYTVGHALALADGSRGTVESDPVVVDIEFPTLIIDDEDASANHGTGVGLDVGFMMRRDRVSFGATVRNLFHTFAWETEGMVFRRGRAFLSRGDNETDFERQPASAAPTGLLARVDEMTLDPILQVGGGYDVSPDLTLVADLRNRFGDGMDVGPEFHAGAGLEYRALRVLELRGGAAVITDGIQYGGGATLALGPVRLSAAMAARQGDLDDSTLGQFTLSFGGH